MKSNILLAMICVLWSFSLYADENTILKAQSWIEKGKQKLKAEKYLEAIEDYKKANEIFSDPKNLFVIASVYGKTNNHCKDALNYWELFFKECQNCNYRDKGISIYDEQRKKCIISVIIESTPTNAKILHQGENWGITPVTKQLIADTYQLSVEHPLANRSNYELKLVAGQPVYEINIKLKLESTKINQTDIAIKEEQKNKNIIEEPVTPMNPNLLYQAGGVGAGLLGLGMVAFSVSQYSDASSMADQASNQMQNQAWTQSRYQQQKSEFEDHLLMGHLFMTAGVVALSASSWLVYQAWFKPTPTVKIQSNPSKIQSNLIFAPNGFALMGSF